MATSIGEPEGLQGLRDEMREALVFDYDGVLADTEFLHWKSWELCFLVSCGIGISASDHSQTTRLRSRFWRENSY